MTTETFAEGISFRTADTEMFPQVPESALSNYVVITDDCESWIVTTSASAEALDVNSLPNADMDDYTGSEYSGFWSAIAESVEFIGDCNNKTAAAAAICAREGVEMIED